MPLIAAFFVRIARAAQVLWLLVADGSTRRRLPWPYLRRRVSRDPIMMVQLTGIAAAALFYPASFLLPEPARGPTIQLLVDRRSAQRLVSGALEPNGMTIGVVHFAVPVAPESVDGCEVTVVSRAGQCCVHVIDCETS